MQPPRLAAIAYGKLSSHTCSKAAVLEPQGFSHYATTFRPIVPPATRCLRCFDRLDPISYFSCLKPRDMGVPPEKLRHSSTVTHIATGHEPTFARKASPTRTPPPICTSAPFLKPRWSQDRGRREPAKKYTMLSFSQSI